MKKTLEDELMSLAHRILHLRGGNEVEELKNAAGELYEKLTVLAFAEKHFSASQPSIGKKEIETALRDEAALKVTEKEEKKEEHQVEETQPVTKEKTEPNKKEKAAEEKNVQTEDDIRNIAVNYDDLPQFEPVTEIVPPTVTTKNEVNAQKAKTKNQLNPRKKSLNESLNYGLSFGLNDRLAFIKNLFEGNAADFDRVISQLNTLQNFVEAKVFIEEQIKPDYNWQEKEVFEERFYTALAQKMER